MNSTGSRKLLSVTILWVLIASLLAASYKYWVSAPIERIPPPTATTTSQTTLPLSPEAQGQAGRFEAAWAVAVSECGDSPDIDEFVKKALGPDQEALRKRLTT